jgi:predicted sugar kinase
MEDTMVEIKRLLEDVLEQLKEINKKLGEKGEEKQTQQQTQNTQKRQYTLKDRIYFFVRKVSQKGPVRLSFLKKVFKNESEDAIAQALAELEKEGKVLIENDTVKLK